MTDLDVLVVYSSKTALSASVTDSVSKYPFSLELKTAGYNLPYTHFLKSCAKLGIKAGFSASSDVIGPGACQSFWKLDELNQWTKVQRQARATEIFDKISPTSPKRRAERKLLLSSSSIHPFNDKELYNTFFDKLLTYQRLPRYSIPTVMIAAKTAISINKALSRMQGLMQKHPFASDFLAKFVLKDRFGSSGEHVYSVETNFVKQIQTIMIKNPTVQFILQPFIAFDQGFTYQAKRASTDIRLIFHHGRILQSYLRLAKAGDFRCNEHQGGQSIYIAVKDIPATILKAANSIVKKINQSESLYSLDFVLSNSGQVYFMEGNFGPGLDWQADKKIDEKMSKQLIDSIVGEFAQRIKKAKAAAK